MIILMVTCVGHDSQVGHCPDALALSLCPRCIGLSLSQMLWIRLFVHDVLASSLSSPRCCQPLPPSQQLLVTITLFDAIYFMVHFLLVCLIVTRSSLGRFSLWGSVRIYLKYLMISLLYLRIFQSILDDLLGFISYLLF